MVNNKLAWGIFYKNEYTPKGDPKHDLKLSLEQRRTIAKRMAGKPFMLAHSDKRIDILGSIKRAFVSDSGDIHAQLEFSHDNFHSILSNNMVFNNQIKGLSLSSIIGVDKNLTVHSMDQPVEGSLVPLSKARRGEDCEIYKLGKKWLCNDSKRNEYNDVLKKAGVLQPKTHLSSTVMENTERQQETGKRSLEENNKEQPSTTTGGGGGGGDVSLLEEFEKLKKAYSNQNDELKSYQENEQVKKQMEEEEKIKKAQTWLDSSVTFFQQLVKEGLPAGHAQKIIASCGAAIKARNIEKLDELEPMMQLVHSSHAHSRDVTTRYMEQLDQTRKMQEERKKAVDDQQKLQTEISKFNEQRRIDEEIYNRHGIGSRVDTTQFKSPPPSYPSSSSSSSYSSAGAPQKKQKERAEQQHQPVHFDAGTVHRNVSSDRRMNPASEGSNRAPKPRITNKMYEMAHKQFGLGIPETGGMKKHNPEQYNQMLGDFKANGYTGHTAFENSAFSHKTFWGGDIPDNSNFGFSASQPPVVGDAIQ